MKNIMKQACLFILYGLSNSSPAFAQYDTTSLPKPNMNFHSQLLNPLNEQPRYLKNLSPDAYLQSINAWKTIKNNMPVSYYQVNFSKVNHQRKNDFLNGIMIGSSNGLSPSLGTMSSENYYMKSSSSIFGFAMGFLAGGVAGGLLSSKYHTYGAPSPFNDFIHFNRH